MRDDRHAFAEVEAMGVMALYAGVKLDQSTTQIAATLGQGRGADHIDMIRQAA
jgi:hypothetical protein